jgi:hypothetical protein
MCHWQIPYLVVFQAEIGNATHGGRLALGKILVHLVDALRNVVVRFVKQFSSTGENVGFRISSMKKRARTVAVSHR